VVVNDRDVVGVAALPSKAHAPLAVDADAVLATPITLQRLDAIGWRYAKVVQCGGVVEHPQLSPRDGLNVARKAP
jgi:hypothetical protein